MPRRHAAEQLPYEQFKFLIDCIVNHKTDRAIEALFKEKFNQTLSKSAIGRWRDVAGDELARAFMLTRYQAEQLLNDIKKEGADKFEVVIDNIEDRLLTAMAEGISQDPLKLLQIRQEESRRRQKDRDLDLKERALDLERERVHGVALDRVKLGEEFSSDLLEYIGNDAEGLTWFRKHAKPFIEFIQKKHAEAKA